MTLHVTAGRGARRWWRVLLPLAGAVLVACEEGTSPAPRAHAHRLLVPGTEEAAGLVVDLDRGTVVRQIAAGKFEEQTHALLSADGSQLVTVGRMANDEWLLVGLSVATGQELWHQTLAMGDQPFELDGVQLGRDVMALHPNRPEVFLARSTSVLASGVAVFDYQRRRVVDLVAIEATRIRQLVVVPGAATGDCLVAAADTGFQQDTRAYLVAACGAGYAGRDTVELTLPSQIVRQMERTPDGSRILLGTNTELILVDPVTWQVTRRASRPLPSRFFTSKSDGRLYLPDAGNSTVASSGIMYVLDAGLELASIVDLGVLSFDERPKGVHGGAVSLDGRWAYLIGGVDREGTAYGPEETRVFIIDLGTGEVAEHIALGTVGGAPPFLIP